MAAAAPAESEVAAEEREAAEIAASSCLVRSFEDSVAWT